MPSDYPRTDVPYDGWALPDLHDPVVLGPGFGSMEDSAAAYAKVAEALETAAGDLRAVMSASQAATEGDAAEASRRHIGRVAAAGDAGVAQAKLAMYALDEQASYYARARMDMRAALEAEAAVAPVNAGEAIMDPRRTRLNGDLEAARIIAVEAARLYQNNSNHNLDNGFQAFEPPPESAVDVSQAAPRPAPAWGAGGVGAGANGLGAAGPAAVDAAGVGGSGPVPGGSAPPTLGGAVPTAPDTTAGGSVPPRVAVPGAGPLTPAGVGRTPAGPSLSRPGPGDGGKGTGRGPALPGGNLPGPAATSPQSDRPLSGSRNGAPPGGSSTGSGWVPGQPWSSRPGRTDLPTGGFDGTGAGAGGRPSAGAGPDGRADVTRQPTPGSAVPGATGSGPQRGTGYGPMPFMGGAGGGQGQGSAHPRPPWLVEDDPESIWMSGLPPHGPAVIE